MKRNYIKILTLPLIAILAVSLLWSYNNIHIYGDVSHIAADCNNPGKYAKICTVCGKMLLTEAEPPTEHSFTEWREYSAATASSFGTDVRNCTICGIYETRSVENTSHLPRLYFNGSAVGLTSTSSIRAQFGNSHDDYVQASFLMMDDNEERKFSYIIDVPDEEKSVELGSFGEGRHLLLYAHNDEPTHSHALAHTKLWSSILDGYGDIKKYKLCSAGEGTLISGERSMLYIRNKFAGIYTLTLPYDIIFDKNVYLPQKAAVVKASKDSCDIIYVKNGDSDGVTESFERFVNSCMDNISMGASRYSDINLLADYYNFCKISGFSTGLASDVLWITPDRVKWYPLPLSNEGDTFGTVYGNSVAFTPYDKAEEFENGYFTDVIWSGLLSERNKIGESFDRLVDGIMSKDNVKNVFLDDFATFDKQLVEDEYRVYKRIYTPELSDPDRTIKWYNARLDALSR